MEWEELQASSTVPSLRNSHRVGCTKDGKLYVHGGRGSSSILDDVFCYNVEKSQWSELDTRGVNAPARENHAIDIVNNVMYVFGGSEYGKLSNTMHMLDLVSELWSIVETNGKSPSARERHSMTHINGNLYVFGGLSKDSEFLNDLNCLNLTTLTWTTLNPAKSPIPRNHHTAVAIKDSLYIFGGKSHNGYFNDVHTFSTKSKQWQQPQVQGICPAGRWGHTAISYDQRMLLFGGWNGTWCFNDMHILDTTTKTWSRLPTKGDCPPPRAYHGCTVVADNMFLFGGRNGQRRMDDLYRVPLKDALGSAGTPSSLMMSKTLWRLEDFQMRETLGTGSFGRVRFCQHKPSGKYFAIKILKKAEILRLKQVDHIVSEKTILGSIHHPFIVNMFGAFQDSKFLYILMEYVVGGEFFTHLRRAGRFNNDSSCFYAAQIVLIFQYLHSKDIVYRDLKPENLLLDSRGNIKITDFGFAKKVEYRTWTLCGTPEYIAPEILLNKGHGKPVDWWALGILIYEMLAGAPPFVDDDPMGIYQKILAGRVEFPSFFNRHAKDLISRLLTADITTRLGNLKNGVEDIKRHKWFANINWTKLYNRRMLTPFVPKVSGEDDTRNFEHFPDSLQEPAAISLKNDPFKDF